MEPVWVTCQMYPLPRLIRFSGFTIGELLKLLCMEQNDLLTRSSNIDRQLAIWQQLNPTMVGGSLELYMGMKAND